MTPVVPESYTHVLAEFDCLDPLLSALRLDSGRIKCTCLSVSKKWLALGTSAGGLNLIQRDGWKQKLILTHKEGSITQVACCPHDEDFIAVATSQGAVVVWELHLERRGRPERASVSWEHRGQTVTSLCWDASTLRVFAGDVGGKVSCVRAGSSKLGKGSAFVIFPVQTITTVDSRVVQLGCMDGHLVVSSLSRCYLCDTEREKFWRVGNKERDGEFGACFLTLGQRGQAGSPPPLLYCARPGSRIWEASFTGEVLSTHQFKQLLACPPLPLISYKNEPHYNPEQTSPQSLAFPRLMQFGEQNLLTWTDSAIYIFTPHSGQVLLWTEVKDVAEITVFRNELFCLHGDGRLSHLSLVSPERCVERLLKRENWTLAATVTCMFQHTVITSRARKSLPIDRLEQLKAQLNSASQQQLIGQLEEVISKLEPLDSACSSRRSSISSHESFNVLDCGIYRVISRRGSQSDEDTNSIANQSMLEEERLKEFNFTEEEQGENDSQSVRGESDRSDLGLQFLPLSFRPKPPRVALQAVRDSVSSFMKKTTEKINTLQMNADLWPRPDLKEGVQGDVTAPATPLPDEVDHDVNSEQTSSESELQELRVATQKAVSQIQDPMVLLDPVCLGEVLRDWAPVLERVLGPEDHTRPGESENVMTKEEEKTLEEEEEVMPSMSCCVVIQPERSLATDLDESSTFPEEEDHERESIPCSTAPVRATFPPLANPVELIQLFSPKPMPPDLNTDLSQLACLYLDLGCPGGLRDERGGVESVCVFLRRYFFLLDQERVRKMCMLKYREQPEVLKAYVAGMLEFTQASKVVEVIQKGDLLKSLRSLRDLQPWNAPLLLSHLYRLYEKHGEVAVRAYPQFFPTILPSDIMAMALPSHFLPYLDNLVQSRAEQQRLSFLGSLLQPETLRQDWLELALSHDAPQKADTLTPDGQPRWRSHYFNWGYGRLLSLLIRLPADLTSKQKMLETCRTHGYWMGYLYLCRELQRRSEAFNAICRLDDMILLEEEDGIVPQSLDEWVLLLQLSQQISSSISDEVPPTASLPTSSNIISTTNGTCSSKTNGNSTDKGSPELSNGSTDWSVRVSPENIILRLVRIFGPDQALVAQQESGVQVNLSPRSTLVCDLLRMAEKRQRALIQTMLERCDRFLWSQHA
ncbi:Hermansky-Pudlak syndrome 5 protein [Xyrauchen texanus]|uniref:Hermansky-Pudlak syndrome 5 protein n=1 Tax=Xyrauchen texanus TaxID=154827 RepID=UPI002241EB93|nr:Hermansky-Pudlak syndrome 5 protein [Xyrauchen texanus]XP_051976004.1 Hermansky-Pudlak syndrome 5 protein [Xyrauchen texanus]